MLIVNILCQELDQRERHAANRGPTNGSPATAKSFSGLLNEHVNFMLTDGERFWRHANQKVISFLRRRKEGSTKRKVTSNGDG